MIFSGGIGTRCLVYVDDILVYDRTPEEHHANLQWVLERCKRANLKLNPEKWIIFKTEANFLGRRIMDEGIEPIKAHLDFLNSEQTPKDVALIGSLVYYARFIPRYSEVTQPLMICYARTDNLFGQKSTIYAWKK